LITDSDNTITIEGSNFDFSDEYEARVGFAGVEAETVELSGSAMLIATFDLGVPIVSEETLPILYF
jgi:hypothetical protein